MAGLLANIIEITKSTPNFDGYLEDLAKMLSIVFGTDPMTLPALGITYDANPELHDSFNKVQLQAAFTGAGRVFSAVIDANGTERLAGVAIWYEPGKQFLDDEEQLSYWKEFLGKLSPEIKSWWQEVMLPRYNQLTKEGLGEGVKKDLLHLQVLGVHPEFHQKGIGKTLVRYMLKQSDSRGIASCVETSKEANLLFYTALGYEVKSKVLIPSPHGDFTMWSLYREPPNFVRS